MTVDYDPEKNIVNVRKQGVPLAFGLSVLNAPGAVVVDTVRIEDGERREKAIGAVDGKLWTAVFVRRDETLRFISVRRSNENESRAYHRHSG